ncbi:hypothetical protein RRG08_045394 [Elysia crispata]|uniref:Uncharacterized protein n=1 Tax=Elysia crispata TaxID=231223 RepID=A0AAE1E1U3_9GAST|nr:hypothetical protein RRG08_045394 [Elysia crispata]
MVQNSLGSQKENNIPPFLVLQVHSSRSDIHWWMVTADIGYCGATHYSRTLKHLIGAWADNLSRTRRREGLPPLSLWRQHTMEK